MGATVTRRSFVAGALAAVASSALLSSCGAVEGGKPKDLSETGNNGEKGTKVYGSACFGCITHCPVKVTVTDGVVTNITGNDASGENKHSVCIKGLNEIHNLYSPRHVLHPMRHVKRGTNDWETISWDEAIDLAATKITDSIREYGPYSFFVTGGGGGAHPEALAYDSCYAYGSPNSFEPGGAQCFMPRANAAPLMYGGEPQSIADDFNHEPFNTYCPDMQCLVLWGAQPSVSQTANSGHGMADMRVDRGVKTIVIDPNFSPDASKADIWLPVRPGTDTGLLLSWWRYILENKLYDEEFTKYWTNLPFLINPDTALPYLAEDVWPDYVNPAADPDGVYSTPAYVCFDAKTNSIQPFPYSLPADSPVDPVIITEAEVNGVTAKTAGQLYWESCQEWTLEKAEEITLVPAERNEAAIKLYAESRGHTGFVHGVATDQMRCSSEMPYGIIGLDMIMGNVERPGTTLTLTATHFTDRPTQPWDPFGTGMWLNATGVGWITGMTEEANRKRADEFEDKETQQQQWAMMRDRAGLVEHKGFFWQNNCHIPSVLNMIRTGKPYKPRVWYEFSGNKLAALGNAQSWYDVRDEIDFCIQQYCNLTSFSYEFVDLFLPTESWLEESRCDAILNKTFVQTDVVHLGETVYTKIIPFKILEKAKEKLQPWPVTDAFPVTQIMNPGNEADYHEALAQQVGAPSWAELKEHYDDYVPVVVPEEDYWTYYQYLETVSDGMPAGFATESRKCEPYVTLAIRMGRTGFPFTYPFEMEPASTDYSPICRWVSPVEDNFVDEEYPCVITSGRLPHFHHGTQRHLPFSRELYPAPHVKINPKTAAECGVKNGDWVKVSSRRGSISAIAEETEAMAPRVLWMERYWNPEAFDESQENPDGGWRQCNFNILTDNYIDYDGDDMPYNNVYGSYTLRGFDVKIEPGEKPANIWTEPEEFEPFMPTLKDEPLTEVVF